MIGGVVTLATSVLAWRALSHRPQYTFAVELLAAGVSMEDASVLLGHSSIRTTKRFYAPWDLFPTQPPAGERAERERPGTVGQLASGLGEQ